MGLVTSAYAVPVSVSYQITTNGTGPGFLEKTAKGVHRMISFGPCGNCTDPDFPVCTHPEGVMSVDLQDLAKTPVGEANIFVSFGGGPTYVGSGQWTYGSLECAPVQCPEAYGGGSTGAGTASGGSFSARVPFEGKFRITVPMALRMGTCVISACGCPECPGPWPGCCGCNLGPEPRCCGAGNDEFTVTVTYKSTTPTTVTKTCLQNGTAMVEPDAVWHQVASASCMTVPDSPTGYTCTANSMLDTKCVMIAPGEDPNAAGPSSSGPDLWVKVSPPPLNLKLSVSPKEILPSGSTVPQTAVVTVQVTESGGPASGKVVKLSLSPTANPGHDVQTHTNNSSGVRSGSLSAPQCTTDASGGCTVTYIAAQAAAEVSIKANLADDESVKDETSVKVGVDLGSIPASGLGFVFKDSDAKHTDNRGAASQLSAAAIKIGELYEKYFAALPAEEQAWYSGTLRYTDASLPRGGLYDFFNSQNKAGADWTPPHNTHRFGRDLDISKKSSDPKPNHDKSLRDAMKEALNTTQVANPPSFPLGGGIYDEDEFHYHIRVLEGDGQP